MCIYFYDPFAIFMQVIQQIYVAEEWVRNACDEVKPETHSHFEAKKALGALKEEHKELANKLTIVERERLSALTSLKSAEAQAEDQRKLLYTTKLNLAPQKQLVLNLQAELQKVKNAAKEAARVANEATKVVEKAAYERGVEDTENRLVEEVVGVCREYYIKTWTEALNSVGVPANSELRKAESIFFPEQIQEAPANLPSTALPLPPPKQVSSVQDLALNAEASTGAGKGKEALSSTKDNQFEDTLIIKDVFSQAKEAKSKSEAGNAKLKAAASKEGSQPTEKQLQDFYFFYFFIFYIFTSFSFCCGLCHYL